MGHPTGADEIGLLIGEYRYDWGRARRNAVIWLVVGVLGTAAALPGFISAMAHAGENGYSSRPNYVLVVGISGLAAGVTLLALGFPRRREVLRLHQGGLVHRRADIERTLAWHDIATVGYQEYDNAMARFTGTDVWCVIRPRAGDPIRVTGYHDGAHRLGSAVWRAVTKGEPPTAGEAGLRW
ncbi:hypothetical protein [Streptomyces sp. NPDC058694]|uniref:hypothetical protein n=1 Tax=Streptomyces sp. NPDC058694 TaxID=3346603 RepID=UPI003649A248